MKRRAIPIRREAPKQPHCTTCLKTMAHLRQYADVYECSRVDCTQRKGVTAAPCDKPNEVSTH